MPKKHGGVVRIKNLDTKTIYLPRYAWERFNRILRHYNEEYGFELTQNDILRCLCRRIYLKKEDMSDLYSSKYVLFCGLKKTPFSFNKSAYDEFIRTYKDLILIYDKNFVLEILVNLYHRSLISSSVTDFCE